MSAVFPLGTALTLDYVTTVNGVPTDASPAPVITYLQKGDGTFITPVAFTHVPLSGVYSATAFATGNVDVNGTYKAMVYNADPAIDQSAEDPQGWSVGVNYVSSNADKTGYALSGAGVAAVQSGLATSAAQATLQNDTDDIQTRLPAALVAGKMDSHVADIATDAISAASVSAGAVTKIAAGVSSGASAADIADAVLDEALSGHVTSGTAGWALGLIAALSGIVTTLYDRLLTTIVRLASNVAANGTITIYQFRDSGVIDIPLNVTIDPADVFALYIGAIGDNDPPVTVTATYLTATSVRVANVTALQAAAVTAGQQNYEVKRTAGGLNYQVAVGRVDVERVVKQ